MIDVRQLLDLVDDAELLAEVNRRGIDKVARTDALDLLREVRRRATTFPPREAILSHDGLTVDPVGMVATWRGQTARLTGRESQVLYAMIAMHLQGRGAVAKATLAHKVWPGWEDADALASLRVHVNQLRKKLPDLIVSDGTHGRPYRLALDAATEVAA